MIRMAGTKGLQALKYLLGRNPNAVKKGIAASIPDLGLRLGMDGTMAVINASQTPGDLGDKLLTGLTDFGMSAGTGLVASRPFLGRPGIASGVDMVASVAGGYGSIPVSEQVLKSKDKLMGGSGETPWEKMGREEQERFAQELEQQILAQHGLLYPRSNDYLNPGGLGTGGIG